MGNINAELLQELSCIFPLEIYERHHAFLDRSGVSLPLSTVIREPTLLFLEDRDSRVEGPRTGRHPWPELKACLAVAKSIVIVPCRGKGGARYGSGQRDSEHQAALRDALAADGLVLLIVTGDRALAWVAMARRYAPECEIRILDVEGAYLVQPCEVRRAAA